MIPLYDVLSLWELSHRWHGHHPDATDPEALPLEVIDTLRLLTRALYQHELTLCEEGGVEFGNIRSTVSYERYIASWEEEEPEFETIDTLGETDKSKNRKTITRPPDGIDPEVAKWQEYSAHRENRTRHHNELVKDFPRCFEERKFDKSLLEKRYVTHYSLELFCRENSIPFPIFWALSKISDEEHEENGSKNRGLRNDQLDRQLVQAVAKTLWDQRPNLTISGLTRHKAVLQYGNGKQYVEKTLHKWISEVDPRPKGKKVGRPKKINPDNTGS